MLKLLVLSAWGLGVAAFFLLLPLPAEAGGVVGTGLGTCNEAALDAALAGGGLVTFDCGGVPAEITLTAEKAITLETTLDGAGKITLGGNGFTRLFVVSPTGALNLQNLSLTNG